MMKSVTINKLNNIASLIAEKSLLAAKVGVLCKSPCDVNDPCFISIKKTILKNAWVWHEICGVDAHSLMNIFKTTRQLNYLTNEVLHKLRTHGFYKVQVPVMRYVQSEFNF